MTNSTANQNQTSISLVSENNVHQLNLEGVMPLPEPMTPPESNLKGFDWMELNLTRLFRSEMWMRATGEEFRAALSLWGEAYWEKPAGSLPDDDFLLAQLAGFSRREVDVWKEVKDMALRGWVKCSDGRLYHPVVAETVIRAWDKRVDYINQQEDAKARKQAEREKRKAMIEAIRANGGTALWNETTALLTKKFNKIKPEIDPKSEADVTDKNLSQTCHKPVTPPSPPKTGTETGTETGSISSSSYALPDEEKKKEPEEEDEKFLSESPLDNPQGVLDLFNSILPKLGKVKILTFPRETAIRKYANEGMESLQDWKDFFEKVLESDWLMGRKKNWNADFDWLILEKNYAKVLEDFYLNKPQEENKSASDAWSDNDHSYVTDALRELEMSRSQS